MFNLLLFTPLLAALICLSFPKKPLVVALNVIAACGLLIFGWSTAYKIFTTGASLYWQGLFQLDALNAYIILVVSSVGFLGCIYSLGYMEQELKIGKLNERRFGRYFFWLYLFIFTMLVMVSANNMGVMWVAVEGSTLATALLVGFNNNKASLEAAWKYIVLCSVGITFALLGTILVYFAGVRVMGGVAYALNWTELIKVAGQLNPKLLKLAFVFILVGYGTKAGLVPMHTWLPDAYSQAPSPISALLSGVFLNCALYGVIRYHIILKSSAQVGAGYSTGLLMFFGILSLVFVVPFFLIQHDFKRLLAYSSVEHMGIITVALGFGSKLALLGAFLHMAYHAMTKSAMFFTEGNLLQKYKTKKLHKIRGAIKLMPVTGIMLVLGTLAITGVPPFGIFSTEFLIISSGFTQGHFALSAVMLLCIAFIFAGFIHYISRMAMGNPPARAEVGEISRLSASVAVIPLLVVLLAGLYLPHQIKEVLDQVVTVVGGNN
jgi:hydrogenase-4 component F